MMLVIRSICAGRPSHCIIIYNFILWLLFYYLSIISLVHYNQNLKSKMQFDFGSMRNLRDFCFETR